MAIVHGEVKGNRLVIAIEGRLDSGNANEVEQKISSLREGNESFPITLDFEKLSYISSAGLRIVLRLKKGNGDLLIANVGADIYEILDMTGFTSLATVKRKMREISIEGCPLLGEGGNGKVYRLTDDEIVKIFRPGITLETIEEEQRASKAAFLLGVPCAIAFDNVRCGDSYGTVYEMIDASTLSSAIAANPERLPEFARKSAELLKKLHSIELEEGQMGDAHHVLYSRLDKLAADFAPEEIEMMRKLGDAIPRKNRFVHNDFHCKNIMVSDDELILIDLGDAGMGNPIIDLIHCYMCFKLIGTGLSAVNPDNVSFLGITYRQQYEFWDHFARAYCEDDAEKVKALEAKIAPFAALMYYTTAMAHPRLPATVHPMYASAVRAQVLSRYDELLKTDFEI